MPRMPRPRCIGCNKVVENPRPIINILLKIYLSARAQKRLDSTSCVCIGCRSKFNRWHHKVKDQVDQFILNERSDEIEEVTSNVAFVLQKGFVSKEKMDIEIEKSTKYTQTSKELGSVEIPVDRCSKNER
jgi:hypothetical protein